MSEHPPVSADAGCLGAFVAVAVVALILTIGMIQSFGSMVLYVLVFPATAIAFGAIGFPLYLIARWLRRESLWTAILCGALTGGGGPLVFAIAEGSDRAWLNAAGYGGVGAIGGVAFFLAATANRDPARNWALLAVLVALSAGLAPLAAPLID